MDDVREDRRPEPAWDQVAAGFSELGDLVRAGSADSGKEGSKEELRHAWNGFVRSAQGLGQALATTVSDPEIRAGAKQALGSLVDAIGNTARDVASGATARARKGRSAEGEQSPE